MFQEKLFFSEYYNNDLSILLIFPILISSMLLIAKVIKWATLNSIRKKALILVLLFFLLRLIFTAIAPFNPLVPNFGDSDLFANMISNNYFYAEQSLGVRLYYYLSYPLRVISGFNLISFLILQTFIYYVSMLIIWRAYLESIHSNIIEIRHNKAFIYYYIFVTFYPASLMYISTPLREYFLVFSLSIFILGLTRFIINKKLLLLSSSLILFIMVRPHLIPALLAIIYFSKNYKKISSYFIAIFIPSILLYIFSILIYPITPEKLTEIRFSWADAHPEDVYGAFNWSTWWDVISSLPSLIFQYLASPLPILHNRSPFSMLAGFLDFIYIFVIIVLAILCCINKSTRNKVPTHFLFLIVIMLVLSAIWEAYIGGAIRHRMTAIIPLLPISAYFLSMLKVIKRV